MTYEPIEKKLNSLSGRVGLNVQQGLFNSDSYSGGISNASGCAFNINMAEDFDLEAVNAKYVGYRGLCFDGRYIYFVPYATNPTVTTSYLVRYDTQADFKTAGSYAAYAITTQFPIVGDHFCAGCFDGRYIYLCPDLTGNSGTIIRYDTRASFTSSGSYISFNLASINSVYKGFQGCPFDGRYLYFIPRGASGVNGNLIRYDTTADFQTSGSYTVFNLASINASYTGFCKGCLTKDYLYIIPYNNGSEHGNLIRYNLNGNFTSAGSYEVFGLTSVNANCKGLFGVNTDGMYLYMSTYTLGYFIRYDLSKPFTSTGSYDVKDLGAISATYKGSLGMVSDGKNVYLTPYNNGSSDGVLVKYNGKDFLSDSSYSSIDLTGLNANDKGFQGGLFDGKYIYLCPYYNGSAYVGRVVRIRVSPTELINRY